MAAQVILCRAKPVPARGCSAATSKPASGARRRATTPSCGCLRDSLRDTRGTPSINGRRPPFWLGPVPECFPVNVPGDAPFVIELPCLPIGMTRLEVGPFFRRGHGHAESEGQTLLAR
jgi:hypothetical protein